MLSDTNVITAINRDFIPVEVNISVAGFPDLPALFGWKLTLAKDREGQFSFSDTAVLDESGATLFGHSGRGSPKDFLAGGKYEPELYLRFLEQSLQRYKNARGIAADPSLSSAQKAEQTRSIVKDVDPSIKPVWW